MRPLTKNELNAQRHWGLSPDDNSIVELTADGQPLADRNVFAFDKTFGEDVSTKEVYDSMAKNIVGSALSGLNGIIFAYGQTSSGKTYTMQGTGTISEGSVGDGGIFQMAAKDLFQQIEGKKNGQEFIVRVSFLEIYNDVVRDLSSEGSSTGRKSISVQGSKGKTANDYESLLRILIEGEKSRTEFASTKMNERSSRSHTIFRITIKSWQAQGIGRENQNPNVSGSGAVTVSTLDLVDLAGSESVRRTDATGDRLKEGGMINKRYDESLSLFVQCNNWSMTYSFFSLQSVGLGFRYSQDQREPTEQEEIAHPVSRLQVDACFATMLVRECSNCVYFLYHAFSAGGDSLDVEVGFNCKARADPCPS